MLGIQNSMQVTNPVRFGQASYFDDYDPEYDIEDVPAYEVDSFNKAELESRRDAKLSEIKATQQSFNEMADSLDKNKDKLSKGASKVIRLGSAALGLVGTYVMAKCGSKIAINTLRNFGNTGIGKGIIDATKAITKPLCNGAKVTTDALSKHISSPILNSLKNSQLGQKLIQLAEKPNIKAGLEFLGKQKEAGMKYIRSINGDKIQKAIENTMAASATTSVLIDDLAGRNDNKSNFSLALGASGGDK